MDSAAAEADLRRARQETYLEPLRRRYSTSTEQEMEDFKSFMTEFYRNIYKREEQCKSICEKYPDSVGWYYKELVLDKKETSYEDFWQRYFYRCDLNQIKNEQNRSKMELDQPHEFNISLIESLTVSGAKKFGENDKFYVKRGDTGKLEEIDLDDNHIFDDETETIETDKSTRSSKSFESTTEGVNIFREIMHKVHNPKKKTKKADNLLGRFREKVKQSKTKTISLKFRDAEKILQRCKGEAGGFGKSIKNKFHTTPTQLALEQQETQEMIKEEDTYEEDTHEGEIYQEEGIYQEELFKEEGIYQEEELYVDPEDTEIYRQRLFTFYQEHKPENVAYIDTLLEFYQGKEEELFNRIEKEYKVPGVFRDMEKILKKYRGRVRSFGKSIKNKIHTPIKLALEGRRIKKTKKEEEDIYKEILFAFYKEYKPENIDNIDFLLEFYHGKEESLFERIEASYQVNPFRPAFVAFYATHNPEKIESIDMILAKSEGREAEIFRHIKAAYGEFVG